MFDTLTTRTPRDRGRKRWLIAGVSVVTHAAVLAAFVVAPLAVVRPPAPVDIMAFVAPPPVVPPPPPPPPPPRHARTSTARPHATSTEARRFVAPHESPSSIVPERTVESNNAPGVTGGVEGGVTGGVVGGVLGGLATMTSPPPPPPTMPAPVRIGGAIKAPALETSVTPEYPAIALAAHIQGLVILEASVDDTGRVATINVLRSAGLLDKAAIDALKQWRYRPLTLNGQPTPFVLTVTMNFQLPTAAGATSGAP